MTEKNVIDESALVSPWAQLAEQIKLARKTWATLHASLEACYIKTGEFKDTVDPFGVLHLVADIRSNSTLGTQVGEGALSQAEKWAFQQAQVETLAFDQELKKLATRNRVSMKGRFPSYVLDEWLIVRVSPEVRTVEVGTKKIKSLLLQRVWPEITAALKAEKSRKVTPDEFIGSCHKAYTRVLSLRKAKIGSSIPIREIFRELVIVLQSQKFWRSPTRSNFAEYTEEHFSRDLATLMMAGLFVTRDGARMELMPTAFPKEGMPINLAEGVRFIGHIRFEEPSS
jgi:hypothetical protein